MEMSERQPGIKLRVTEVKFYQHLIIQSLGRMVKKLKGSFREVLIAYNPLFSDNYLLQYFYRLLPKQNGYDKEILPAITVI